MGLAMDAADLRFFQDYFKNAEHRDPTVTDCGSSTPIGPTTAATPTFGTHLAHIDIRDPAVRAAFDDYLAARREIYGDAAETRPITLMDAATAVRQAS
jgi:phosphoribosylformylglycinamidine synthase